MMDLLSYVAEQMHFYLSDFHYIDKLIIARQILFYQTGRYPIEEWIDAYQYIFNEDKVTEFQSTKEVFNAIYSRLCSRGTPMDPICSGMMNIRRKIYGC